MSKISIRILEAEPNKRGDLFARLMVDLFLALGYDQIRLNIHKTGREIDVEALHRTEKRRVVAECKATKTKTGGDAINKFVGILDAERRKTKIQTTGYFISLSGFRETAIEQEKEIGGGRVILLDGTQIIEELIKGHIIVPPEKAMERAGRCAAGQPADLQPEVECELLAHEIGWVWVVYFAQKKQRTHFALIHVDGESLAPALAEAIIQSDMSVGGALHSLTYLPPPAEPSISEPQIDKARSKYFQYLANECGEIPLEGLPADQEVGTRRLKLENIFVPLHLNEFVGPEQGISLSRKRYPVGEILSECSRLAILAAPGGGKTTLLKRLALAYTFPERSRITDDDLPDRPWFPLFVRCRQLGDLVRSPITDILHAIPERAEMTDLKEAFVHLANDALQSGNALLLIDGLDEISDESDRVSFANQLRTFLTTYPTAGIVLTSRVAGFRIIGGTLGEYCKHFKVADFDDNDIMRLVVAWHKEVDGDRKEVRQEAEMLARMICDSDRVRHLAANPLLLTTLLLVNRWMGQLPTRRSVLYGKAIEVLLMTWNVAGYEPIDQEEAIPQLAFLAYSMMQDGVQRISSRRLKEILHSARKQMPEVLGYAKFSVSEFIQRVELRSSLLALSGYEIERGTLYPMYEFQHLTFQEYLAARAIVEGYYSNRSSNDTLLTILEPHLADERWKEVVPLAAVLAGRKAQPFMQHLVELCENSPASYYPIPFEENFSFLLLFQCILDEAQIPPDLLEKGLKSMIERRNYWYDDIQPLCRSKFGKIFQEITQEAYIRSCTDMLGPEFINAAYTLSYITLDQLSWKGSKDLTPQFLEKVKNLLANENPIQRAAGALAVKRIAIGAFLTLALKGFEPSPIGQKISEVIGDQDFELSPIVQNLFEAMGDHIVPSLYADEPYVHFAASWALGFLGRIGTWAPEREPGVLSRLIEIWRKSQMLELRTVASMAICMLPIVDRELRPLPNPDSELIDFIKKKSSLKMENWINALEILASLIIGFYWKIPWTDEELANLVAIPLGQFYDGLELENPILLLEKLCETQLEALLDALGEYGKAQLEALRQEYGA